jgi:hypothetical protein
MDAPLEKLSYLLVHRRIKVHGSRNLQQNLLFPGHLFQGMLFPVTGSAVKCAIQGTLYPGFFKENLYEVNFSHTVSCMTSDDI